MRRLNPLSGGGPVDMWTALRPAHIPTGEQNQKKRTNDVLPKKPDNFIRYRQRLSSQPLPFGRPNPKAARFSVLPWPGSGARA